MNKIILEREKCIGCGSCVAFCPKYFEMAEDGKSVVKGGKRVGENDEIEVKKIGCVQEAVDNCPVQAIHIK